MFDAYLLTTFIRLYEAQITEQSQQLREIVMLKDHMGQLQTKLAQAPHEKEELAADPVTSQAKVQRLRSQATPSSDTMDSPETVVAVSPVAAASE